MEGVRDQSLATTFTRDRDRKLEPRAQYRDQTPKLTGKGFLRIAHRLLVANQATQALAAITPDSDSSTHSLAYTASYHSLGLEAPYTRSSISPECKDQQLADSTYNVAVPSTKLSAQTRTVVSERFKSNFSDQNSTTNANSSPVRTILGQYGPRESDPNSNPELTVDTSNNETPPTQPPDTYYSKNETSESNSLRTYKMGDPREQGSISQIYQTLDSLFGRGETETFQLEFPGRILEQLNYFYPEANGLDSQKYKPQTVFDAEFRLANDCFDIGSHIVTGPNGSKLSSAYTELVNVLVPSNSDDLDVKTPNDRLQNHHSSKPSTKHRAEIELVEDQERIISWLEELVPDYDATANKDIFDFMPPEIAQHVPKDPSVVVAASAASSQLTTTTTATTINSTAKISRIELYQKLVEHYEQQRFRWEQFKMNARPADPKNRVDIEKYDKMLASLAPIVNAKLEALWAVLLIRGQYRRIRRYIGFIDVESPSEILQRAKENLRSTKFRSLDNTEDTYPVILTPINWAQYLSTNFAPEDLLSSGTCLWEQLHLKQRELKKLLSRKEALQDVPKRVAILEEAEKEARDAHVTASTAFSLEVGEDLCEAISLGFQTLAVRRKKMPLSASTEAHEVDESASKNQSTTTITPSPHDHAPASGANPDPKNNQSAAGKKTTTADRGEFGELESFLNSLDLGNKLKEESLPRVKELLKTQQEARDKLQQATRALTHAQHQQAAAKEGLNDAERTSIDDRIAIISSDIDFLKLQISESGAVPRDSTKKPEQTTSADSTLKNQSSNSENANDLAQSGGSKTGKQKDKETQPNSKPQSTIPSNVQLPSDDGASVWTEVHVQIGNYDSVSTSNSGTSSSHSQTGFGCGWFFGGTVSTSSESSHALSKFKSTNTKILVGFRAMKVAINRPWFDARLLSQTDQFCRMSNYRISAADPDTVHKAFTGVAGHYTGAETHLHGPQDEHRDVLKESRNCLLPSWTKAFILAKDIHIIIEHENKMEETEASSFANSISASGNILCFSTSSGGGSSSGQSSAAAVSHSENRISIKIPAPQIIGWVSQLAPEDESRSLYTGLTKVEKERFLRLKTPESTQRHPENDLVDRPPELPPRRQLEVTSAA